MLTIALGVPQDLEHLGVGRVLAQGPHHIPALAVQDLAIACSVKQLESLLEFWDSEEQQHSSHAAETRYLVLLYTEDCSYGSISVNSNAPHKDTQPSFLTSRWQPSVYTP